MALNYGPYVCFGPEQTETVAWWSLSTGLGKSILLYCISNTPFLSLIGAYQLVGGWGVCEGALWCVSIISMILHADLLGHLLLTTCSDLFLLSSHAERFLRH